MRNPTDLAIDPDQLTAGTVAARLAELVTHYTDRNNPGPFDSDTWDEMVALATAWRARTGWDDDRNETALEITDGGHDGVDPTRDTDADWAPLLAGCTSTAPAPRVEYIGWPNSVRREVAA